MARQQEVFEPIDRNTRWCAEGRQAFQAGKIADDCPYAIGTGDQRIGWFTGWYDERMNSVLGPVFARLGIKPDKSRGEAWSLRKSA